MGNGDEIFFVFRLNPKHKVTVDQVGNHLPVSDKQVEPLNVGIW
jgi:hypothetical protein